MKDKENKQVGETATRKAGRNSQSHKSVTQWAEHGTETDLWSKLNTNRVKHSRKTHRDIKYTGQKN